MLVGFRPDAHLPTPLTQEPLNVAGALVELQPAVKYLGVQCDTRLSFSLHWKTTCSRAKAAIGQLRRLVGQRHRKTLLIAIKTRVLTLLLHSLPFTPPTTRQSWLGVERVLGFASRTLLNDWDTGRETVIESAGLPTARALFVTQAMRFVFSTVHGRRSNRSWLERWEGRPGLRSSDIQTLRLPHTRLLRFQRLAPTLLPALWNAFVAYANPTNIWDPSITYSVFVQLLQLFVKMQPCPTPALLLLTPCIVSYDSDDEC